MKAGNLHFTATGSGPASIICIHGWGCDGGQFTGLAADLAKDFRVFCLDLPGHGQTPLGSFVPGWESYANVIVDFALEHGLRSPILLGHSMGGILSLFAAASGRIEPRAVINLDGGLPPAEKTLAGQKLLRTWLDEPNFRPRLAAMLRETFFLPAERDSRCEEIIHTMCSAPEAVLRFLPEHVEELHAAQTLPKITCPVLFVGSAAPRFDLAQARAALPQLRYEQIPDAGHFLHIYGERALLTILRHFFSITMLSGIIEVSSATEAEAD